jgi:hypothetical protein
LQQIKVIKRPYSDNPWSIENAPIELRVPARLVKGWIFEKKNVMKFDKWEVKRDKQGKIKDWYINGYEMKKGSWTFTPPLPDEAMLKKGLSDKVDTVTLVPYGCSKLRITVFPKGI